MSNGSVPKKTSKTAIDAFDSLKRLSIQAFLPTAREVPTSGRFDTQDGFNDAIRCLEQDEDTALIPDHEAST